MELQNNTTLNGLKCKGYLFTPPNLVPPWTTAVHGTNATITVIDAGTSETITVTIPKNGSTALFARLKVIEPAP